MADPPAPDHDEGQEHEKGDANVGRVLDGIALEQRRSFGKPAAEPEALQTRRVDERGRIGMVLHESGNRVGWTDHVVRPAEIYPDRVGGQDHHRRHGYGKAAKEIPDPLTGA